MNGTSDRFQKRQFACFLLAGGCAAAVNVASRCLLAELFSFRWSVVIAYLIGMVVAWVLSRLFVFEPSGRHWSSELIRFGIVNIFAVAQVWLISVGLAEWVFPHLHYDFHAETTAHAIGVAVPAITSYFGHRYFSFSKRQP